MPGLKSHLKVSTIDPLVAQWLDTLPPARFVLAQCYIVTLIDDVGLPEQVAAEVVYKTGLLCVAQRSNGNGK